MRIKTIEKDFPLDQIFESVKPKIESEYELDENSYVSGSNFLLLGINVEDKSIVVRGSVDNSMRRTYISVTALKSQDFSKVGTAISVGKAIYSIISSGGAAANPFMGLAIKGLKAAATKYDLVKTEKSILEEIKNIIYTRFDYREELFDHPFDVTEIDGALELWENIYGPYINSIENRLMGRHDLSSARYRNYDFSRSDEDQQRIIDLVVLHEQERAYTVGGRPATKIQKKILEVKRKKKGYGTHDIWLTFVITNKSLGPMNMRQIMNLSEQLGNFARRVKEQNPAKARTVTATLIFLSLYGFDSGVGSYLRQNIFRDTEGIIPVFIVPPTGNNIWNNFKATEFTKSDRRKKIMHSIKKGFDISGTAKHGKLDMLKVKKKLAEKDQIYLNKWAGVLHIDEASSLLDESLKTQITALIDNYNFAGGISIAPISAESVQLSLVPSSGIEDIKSKMRDLKELLDDGLITQEDFEVKKKDLLSRL